MDKGFCVEKDFHIAKLRDKCVVLFLRREYLSIRDMAEFSVVLVEPLYGGNIGSIARLMMNFGLKDLVLVNPPPLEKEARMMAVHAKSIMDNAWVVDDFSKLPGEYDCLAAMTAVVGTDSNSTRTPVLPEDLSTAFDTDARVALVFGREDRGLSNEEIKMCDIIVTIPTDPAYRSMNLSHAVAVILYELSRQKRRAEMAGLKKMRKADRLEKESPSGEIRRTDGHGNTP